MNLVVEEVVFDGHLCVAEVGIFHSEEPGPWVSQSNWMKALQRIGVDKPRERVHHYLGACVLSLSRPHPFPCRCGHSELAFTTPSPTGSKKKWVQLEQHQLTTKPPLTLLIGQCSVCRRVIWGVVAKPGKLLPGWLSVDHVQNKTAFVNGPPRRLV